MLAAAAAWEAGGETGIGLHGPGGGEVPFRQAAPGQGWKFFETAGNRVSMGGIKVPSLKKECGIRGAGFCAELP